MSKVKIKILRNTVCGGEPVEAGDVVNASESDAKTLVAIKKAEYVEKAAPKGKQTRGEGNASEEKGGLSTQNAAGLIPGGKS
jgi:hypothetical protein